MQIVGNVEFLDKIARTSDARMNLSGWLWWNQLETSFKLNAFFKLVDKETEQVNWMLSLCHKGLVHGARDLVVVDVSPRVSVRLEIRTHLGDGIINGPYSINILSAAFDSNSDNFNGLWSSKSHRGTWRCIGLSDEMNAAVESNLPRKEMKGIGRSRMERIFWVTSTKSSTIHCVQLKTNWMWLN